MSVATAHPASPHPPDPAGIIRPGPDRWLEAIHALLGRDRAAAQRFLAFAKDSRMRLDGLWSRVGSEGTIVQTVLAAASPGRTATFFATPARRPGEVPSLAELIDVAGRGLGDLDVDLGQALVDPRELLQLEAFERGGMQRLATLSYLERPMSDRVSGRWGPLAPGELPEDIRFERWDPSRRDELIATLERTYVDTLDCPALAGLRRGQDILEGHLHSGQHEPELWTVVRFASGPRAGQPAGVSLFNSSPALDGGQGSIELVYLGLVPEARGRGLGSLVLRHAFSLLAGRKERAIVLAVDERNGPALALYRSAGFKPVIRRVAFIRPRRGA